MDIAEAKKKLDTRKRAIAKAARDLQIAFNAEREAVDRLYKEFTKLREMQADGLISREFHVPTQASKAWLHKAGTEEVIRQDLPWAQGKAVIDKSVLPKFVDAMERNLANLEATTPNAADVAHIEKQAEWEAEQKAITAKRWKREVIRSGLQSGLGDGHDPEDDSMASYIIAWALREHPDLEISREEIREVLTGLGYFNTNVTDRARKPGGGLKMSDPAKRSDDGWV